LLRIEFLCRTAGNFFESIWEEGGVNKREGIGPYGWALVMLPGFDPRLGRDIFIQPFAIALLILPNKNKNIQQRDAANRLNLVDVFFGCNQEPVCVV
jgi:hypothetical protein